MRNKFLHWAAILGLLVVAGYLRFAGLMWGNAQYQHPDERFLIWVVDDLAPVEHLRDYFDTAHSTLNPANRGHTFFVYGTLPVFATRYLTSALFPLGGWEQIMAVGRGLSALSDLLTVVLVYLTARRLMDRWLAWLAAWFSAAAVLQIQQAHFFTVDSFATAFTMLAIYQAVMMLTPGQGRRPGVYPAQAAWFGAAVGLAMACKLNTFPAAFLLPVVLLVDGLRRRLSWQDSGAMLNNLAAGGLVAFLVFRFFQPYAFQGPTFLHILPDPAWVQTIQAQRAQAAGDVDFPPSLQWARRPPWFSFENMLLWGLGVPLGLAAAGGVVGLGLSFLRRIRCYEMRASLIRPPWNGLALVWVWAVVYFIWQSLAWNPTMRYQLPIYPTLAIVAAWGIGALGRIARARKFWRGLPMAAGGLAAMLTLTWALAFIQIYLRPETREAASLWIYDNIPGPVNLKLDNGTYQILPVEQSMNLTLEKSYRTGFSPDQSGWLTQIDLPFTRMHAGDDPELDARIVARLLDPETGDVLDASVNRLSVLGDSGRVEMVFDPFWVERDQLYALDLHLTSLGGALQIQLDNPIQLRLYGQQIEIEEGESEGVLNPTAAATLRRVRLVAANLPAVLPAQITLRRSDGETRIARLSQAPGSTAPLLILDPPLPLLPGSLYLATLEDAQSGQWMDLAFHVQALDGPVLQSLPPPVRPIESDAPLTINFRPTQAGVLNVVSLWRAVQEDPVGRYADMLQLTLADSNTPAVPLVRTSHLILPARAGADPRGEQIDFILNRPIRLDPRRTYLIRLSVVGSGGVAIRGSAPATETVWDMGLPFRERGFDAYGTIYQRGLNLNVYWDDNADKFEQFVDTLDQADEIFISSNRQWGSITRLPERYPLTTEYYRRLLGCPAGHEVVWCYRVAEAGDFYGELGFDLVRVFTSYPGWGSLGINTQFAEEAFSVYDHPKVFVFRKRLSYDPVQVREILGAVDLDTVVHLSPRKASAWSSLLLPAARWTAQQASDTWSQLFPLAGWQNRSQAAATVLWWAFFTLLGWLAYPLLWHAFPGLHDRGYPFARLVGLLLLAYPVWLAGSLGANVTPTLIALALLGVALVGLALAWKQRRAMVADLMARPRYYLGVELLALAGFLVFVGVRAANPDLWHVIFGGEKPMDFSYFNAVLKSSSFPPYDPWFAGGLMNYYYYGFVIFGMPVKLLGITPAVAYNLLLPAAFSLVILGAFSLGWNLYMKGAANQTLERPGPWGPAAPWRAGLLAAVALLVLGNLGTVRMVWQGWQRLSASQEQIDVASFAQRVTYAFQGAQRNLSGQPLAYYPGDWYWIPSRAIQPGSAGEITEYPFFSFLYGDPHAHLFALPLTLLALAWALAVIVQGARWDARLAAGLGLGLGALVVGSLRAANSWDHPTYLVITLGALLYGGWISARHKTGSIWRRGWWIILPVAGFGGLSALFFLPFEIWFRQGYTTIQPWHGVPTGLSSYLVHWGLFLFVLAAWLVQEAIDWMAATPLSALKRLHPYQPVIAGVGLALGGGLVYLLLRGVSVAWVVIPMGAFCLALILRPGQPSGKRAVLFLVGSGLALTLFVEVYALQGDRMNTVFKFCFQAWTMLSLSAAIGLAWLLHKIHSWPAALRRVWLMGLCLLALACLANTVSAARAKMADRMAPDAPLGLDGMAYMQTARLLDGPPGGEGREMDLSQDYRAIRWMQENVSGTPVIVEMHTGEYRHWGNRFTIYTGFPGVIGWENHQRQQRPEQGAWITRRIADVQSFYLSTDRDQAAAFLRRYHVEYIIVGQLERIYAPGPGLEKFPALAGDLWERVYAEGETEIYRVLSGVDLP